MRIQRALGDIGSRALAAAAARPGEHVIDIGCGTGDTTAALAKAVAPGGHVLGVDISETLVGAARSHRLDNATFFVGDAATHPFKAASYDLVFSRFGVMFFGDPVAAFRNIRGALKPAGRLAFVAWRTPQENPWGTVPLRAAQPFLPPLPRPGPEDPGQFSFGDRVRVERILMSAGFSTLRIEPFDQLIWMGDSVAEVVAGSGRFGPLARAFANAEPAAVEKAKQAIAEVLAPHGGPEGVRLPGACWLVTANAR
jgi:SAM-dependent methyltransferase